MRYQVGQRWRCERDKEGRESFTFVILGPGSKPDRKLCKIVWDRPHGYEQISESEPREFTHKHLKKYAVLQEES